MTRVFLSGTTATVAEVWFEGDCNADACKLKHFKLKIGALEGALAFTEPLTIPTFLITGRTNPNDPDKRLLRWDEAVKEETRAIAATAFNKLYDELRHLAIKHDGSTEDGVTADFLGIRAIA